MSEIVAKFGGTSMARPELVANIIREEPDIRYVVVSAAGKRHEDDISVTKRLIKYASLANKTDCQARDLQEEVVEHIDSPYGMLPYRERKELRDYAYRNIRRADQTAEYYIGLGETASAQYFAQLIGSMVVTPHPIHFYGAELNRPATKDAIRRTDARFSRVTGPLVVPGFIGVDEHNRTQLLGWGGSDRTAILIAAALGLSHYNFTDVDGIYSANPKEILTPRLLDVVTYDEVREGAHGGSEVLQGDSMIDLDGADVEITVRNTFNPSAPGTRVVKSRPVDPLRPILAVSSRPLNELRIVDKGMANQKGYVRRVLSDAEELRLSFEHMPASQDAVTLTFSEGVGLAPLNRLAENARKRALSPEADVSVLQKAVVYVIGEGLRDPRVASRTLGKLLAKLDDSALYQEAVVSHASSPSMALVVDRDSRRAVQGVIYENFIR